MNVNVDIRELSHSMNDRLKAQNEVNEREVNEYSLIHELYS